MAFVVQIYIDKAVALAHLPCGAAHKIDTTPWQVSHQFHTVMDSLLKGPNMVPQIGNPVIIMNFSIRIHMIDGSQTVLYNKEWLFIPVI